MTREATGHVSRIANAVLLFHLRPDQFLRLLDVRDVLRLGRGVVGWLPSHIGDLLLGAEVPLRLAVAVEAPAHGERGGLLDDVHLVDAAVAGDATDAVVYVGAVV